MKKLRLSDLIRNSICKEDLGLKDIKRSPRTAITRRNKLQYEQNQQAQDKYEHRYFTG